MPALRSENRMLE